MNSPDRLMETLRTEMRSYYHPSINMIYFLFSFQDPDQDRRAEANCSSKGAVFGEVDGNVNSFWAFAPGTVILFSQLLIVRHANEIPAGSKVIQALTDAGFNDRANGRMKRVVIGGGARRCKWLHGLDEGRGWRWLLRDVNVALFVFHAVSEVLAHSLGNLAEVDKAIGHVNQLRSGVGAKAGNLDATAFVRDGVNGIDEVFIAGYKDGRVVAAGQ